jgi:hypothetical protein
MKQLSADKSLVRSLASDSLAEVLIDVADVSIDAVIESGSLDGIPIIGLFTRGMKAICDFRGTLFMRKVATFLQQVAVASPEDRHRFVETLDDENQQYRFGEAILLLLDRAEDMEKPRIIGRLVAAIAAGQIKRDIAMRLAYMVGRSYSPDLQFLREFGSGTQGENTPIAESLFSAGFLSNNGIVDGGNWELKGNGGGIYELNTYGELIVEFGLT